MNKPKNPQLPKVPWRVTVDGRPVLAGKDCALELKFDSENQNELISSLVGMFEFSVVTVEFSGKVKGAGP